MTDKIIAAPPVAEEKLIVRDSLGSLREYNLAAVRENMEKLFGMDPATPNGDVIRFMVMCQVTGANLFLKEAQILPFKLKGKMTGAEYLTVRYWDRIAANDPDVASIRNWPVDDEEKAVPVTTRDPERARGAVCELYRHNPKVAGQIDLFLRVVVSVDDVMKRYPPKEGQELGDPIGDFWGNPHKRINMLMKCARHKALSRGLGSKEYQEQEFADIEPELTEADTVIEEPTEADAEADDVIEADFEEVEAPPEPEAPPDDEPQAEPPAPVVDTERGKVRGTVVSLVMLGKDRAAAFREYVIEHFTGDEEQKKQLSDGLTAWLQTEGKVLKLEDLPEDLLPDLYAWANEAADIPLPNEPAFDEPPPVEPVKLGADPTESLVFDIRKHGQALGYDDELVSEMIEARTGDPARLSDLAKKLAQAVPQEAADGPEL